MRHTRRGKLAALVLSTALVAAACSDDEESTSTTTAATTATTSGDTTAETTADTAPVETTGETEVETTEVETTEVESTEVESTEVESTEVESTEVETTGGETGEPAGGTITYAAEQEYTSYNNATADQVLFANTLVLNMVQPGPFISNPDLSLTVWEEMMESVEVVSEDPQVVEYRVRPEAVWEDGEPIDCDDFYLSWMSQNGKAGNQLAEDGTEALDEEGNPIPVFNAAGTTGYELISEVSCADEDRTITTTYESQFVDYKVLFGGLIPAHVVERESGVEDLTTATDPADLQAIADVWNEGFIGFDPERALSGAWYRIDQWNEGETLILVRNENFYGEPAQSDEIIYRLVADASQQPTALDNGDVQVVSPQPNPDLLAQLQALDGVVTKVEQGVTFEHLDFNQANPILADVNIRKAIALCIDRQEIVDTLIAPLNPDATVLNNRIFIPSQPEYESHGDEYMEQDIEASKALIEESGWTMGADGVYEKDGQRLSLRLGRRDPNPRRQSTNELISAQCAEAGMELVDDPAEDFNAVRLPASDYDIALFAWVATAALASNTSIYTPPAQGGGQNWNNYVNEELVDLFNQANADFDPESRAATYNQIDQIIWDDMATLPLFQFQELVAYSENIENVEYNGPLGVTWNANEWTVTDS